MEIMTKRIPFLLIFFLVFPSQELLARKEQSRQETSEKPKRSAVVFYKKPFVQDGISFQLKQISVFLTNTSGLDAGATDKSTPVFVVRYKMVNNNRTRKVDLKEPLVFDLQDEFGNTYGQLPQPGEYSGPVAMHDPNFPSLYPGESVQETLFFEAPIAGSCNLFLAVNAVSAGMHDGFVLKIPTKDIAGVEQIVQSQNIQAVDVKPIPVPVGPIKIISPVSGDVVQPGETVHIRVEVPKSSPRPDSVYMVVPAYVLEDQLLEMQYDLKIPETSHGSMAVTVIGKWNKEDGEEVLSDSIVLKVEAPANVIKQ